jgi:hypothetical protein
MNEPHPPYAAGSETSREAAESVAHVAPSLREHVFAIIRQHSDGLTCDQVEAITGRPHQTISARFYELRKMGRLIGSGWRYTRSGRKAVVYFAKEDQ